MNDLREKLNGDILRSKIIIEKCVNPAVAAMHGPHSLIPDFKRQPRRLNRVYRFIMERVCFSPLLFKLFVISLLCKRLTILHYLTNVHMYFVFIFVHNFLVLFFT